MTSVSICVELFPRSIAFPTAIYRNWQFNLQWTSQWRTG